MPPATALFSAVALLHLYSLLQYVSKHVLQLSALNSILNYLTSRYSVAVLHK